MQQTDRRLQGPLVQAGVILSLATVVLEEVLRVQVLRVTVVAEVVALLLAGPGPVGVLKFGTLGHKHE